MECNRDEAFRAKMIAENKFADKDFAGAKKFAFKAQTLYPELDGISQMLTTLDVYISAANKVHGESDWYGVLGVNPSNDDETIRKQYRKLVLILHPDKNRSVGADGAFKILSEAWSLLSDKDKRLAYNQRRDSQGFSSSCTPGVNGVHFANRATSKSTGASVPYRVPHPFPARAQTSVVHRTDTFWTICRRCKMHYEYLKVYLNHTLSCPNCRKLFFAKETAAPVHFPKMTHSYAHQWHPGSSNHVPSSQPNGNIGPILSNNTNIHLRREVHGNASRAANAVNERLKRDREELYATWSPSKRR